MCGRICQHVSETHFAPLGRKNRFNTHGGLVSSFSDGLHTSLQGRSCPSQFIQGEPRHRECGSHACESQPAGRETEFIPAPSTQSSSAPVGDCSVICGRCPLRTPCPQAKEHDGMTTHGPLCLRVESVPSVGACPAQPQCPSEP